MEMRNATAPDEQSMTVVFWTSADVSLYNMLGKDILLVGQIGNLLPSSKSSRHVAGLIYRHDSLAREFVMGRRRSQRPDLAHKASTYLG